MESKFCEKCGKQIPEGRLEVLPDTTTCVKCSKAKKTLGVQVSNSFKGIGSEVSLIKEDNESYIRSAKKFSAYDKRVCQKGGLGKDKSEGPKENPFEAYYE